MNFAVDHMFRLAPRGGAGLSCDEIGVALGAADLARVHLEAGGRRRCEVRPPAEVGWLLKAAYGPQPDAVVQRLHRGLNRTAKWLEAGDLCHAGVEAVMLGFPDLTPAAMVKLAEIADLEKRGAPWEDEPRVPAGQAGGGQWTTGGAAPVKPAVTAPPSTTVEPARPAAPSLPAAAVQPAVLPVASASRRPSGATLDDGVYHLNSDGPRLFQIDVPPEAEGEGEAAEIGAGTRAEEEGERRYQRNELPGEINNVQELFPRLKDHPSEVASFDAAKRFGVVAYADEIGAPGEANLYAQLQAQTKAIDPSYNDRGVFPKGGFASLSGPYRARLIDDVLMDRAAAYYKMKGDPTQLQIETLRFLHKTVDHYYPEAIKEIDAKPFKARGLREIAIGKYVDTETRQDLQRLFNRKGIPYGPDRGVAINNRDYTGQGGKARYRVPDLRIGDAKIGDAPIGEVKVGNLTIDWTIRIKQPGDVQIWDFIHAKSQPKGVIIVIPSQRFPPGALYIPRAAVVKGTDLCLSPIHF